MNILEEQIRELPNEEDLDFVKTEKIAVEDEEDVEIDVFTYTPQIAVKTEIPDPFLRKSFEGMPSNAKKRADRLQKSADTGKSKSIAEQGFITAYDVLKVVSPPHNLDALAILYDTNAAQNAAVTSKAVNVVGLGYDLVENEQVKFKLEELHNKAHENQPPPDPNVPEPQHKTDPDTQKVMDRLKKEKLKVKEQLDDLNEEDDLPDVFYKSFVDKYSLGNGYIEVGRNNSGEINYLGHIAGQTMRVRVEKDGFVQMVGNKYQFFHNFGAYEKAREEGNGLPTNPLGNDPRPNEVIHMKNYSPRNQFYGIPDIVAAMTAAIGDRFAQEYNLDYFENKAVPRYVFILKGAKLSPKAELALMSYFENNIKGKNHGTLYIPIPKSSGGDKVDAEFKAIEVGMQESSFTNYRKENRKDILMANRVPPGKVGIYENSNLAVSRDADKTFKEQVCRPEQRRAQRVAKRIVKEFTTNFNLRFTEASIVDEDIQSRIHDRYARIRVMTPNDIRKDIGKEAVPEGNDFLPFKAPGGAGNAGLHTTEGTKPKVAAGANQTGTNKERGQAQDEGRKVN